MPSSACKKKRNRYKKNWKSCLTPKTRVTMQLPFLRPFFAFLLCFFFNDTATTEIYTLSLHDALPIFRQLEFANCLPHTLKIVRVRSMKKDRKSTRLNSSHGSISYAVFCLKKKMN